MTETYSLEGTDELMVVDASFCLSIPEPGPHYTLIVVSEDGRKLVLNALTASISDAARLMQTIRIEGRITLSEWTDVTDMFRGVLFDKDAAITVPRLNKLAQRLRPVHPYAEMLSLLTQGDTMRVIQVPGPVSSAGPVSLVLLYLPEGIILQHVTPFEDRDDAVELVRNMAAAGGFVTEDFFDVTRRMKSVELDLSQEVQIDVDGKPRFDA